MVMRRASGFVWHTRAIKKRSVSHRVFEVAYIYIDPNGWEISKKKCRWIENRLRSIKPLGENDPRGAIAERKSAIDVG